MMAKYLLFFAFACSITLINSRKFETVYEWKYVDYLWDSDEQKATAIQSGQYNYTRPIIIDVDVWKNRPHRYETEITKVFTTVVRRSGVPASLTTVSDQIGPGGPLLKPYPDWSWAAEGDCSKSITSVYRVAIDSCDRLWVLDNGMIGNERKCPAQLLAFNLHTDELIKQVTIPEEISENSLTKLGLLVTPIVETQGLHCEGTHVYMGDVAGHALVVYDGTSLWRLQANVYASQAAASNFTIAGETFYMDDGVLGIAISPPNGYQSRKLVFRPLSSFDMVSTDVSMLHRSHMNPVAYTVVPNALPNHAAAMAFSKGGVLFFGLMEEHKIACWKTGDFTNRDKIGTVDQEVEYYQFVSGMKVVPRGPPSARDELWMSISKYQKISLGTQNFDEINFRVMKQRVNTLLQGTVCDRRSHHHQHHYQQRLY